MTSIVIAAHDEEAVLGACLDAVGTAATEVIVVANGCTDRTADVARRCGVTVIERAQASKPAALNAGDAIAAGFPRIYLDADVVLSGGGVAALAAALAGTDALAAVPRRDLDLAGRPWPVRSYYAVHARLPAVRDGLYGRGAIALSEAGRARFDTFPEFTADDLFLDSLFSAAERVQVSTVGSRVATPRTTADLLRRLARVRAGNAQLRATGTPVRPARRSSWFFNVMLRQPRLAPAALCYAALTIAAAVLARRRGDRVWGRDESSRVPVR